MLGCSCIYVAFVEVSSSDMLASATGTRTYILVDILSLGLVENAAKPRALFFYNHKHIPASRLDGFPSVAGHCYGRSFIYFIRLGLTGFFPNSSDNLGTTTSLQKTKKVKYFILQGTSMYLLFLPSSTLFSSPLLASPHITSCPHPPTNPTILILITFL